MIIDDAINGRFYGECCYIFPQFDIKIIVDIELLNKKIYIATFLGIDYIVGKVNYTRKLYINNIK